MDNINNCETSFNGIVFLDQNGDVLPDIEKYLVDIQNEPSVLGILNVGDIVKIKNAEYLVKIKYLNFNVPNIGVVDYAGKKLNDESDNLVLFNKKDIEKKLSNEELNQHGKTI